MLNRGVARLPLFEKVADYDAFLRVLAESLAEHPIRVLAFVLMLNHWHLVLWPEGDGDQGLRSQTAYILGRGLISENKGDAARFGGGELADNLSRTNRCS